MIQHKMYLKNTIFVKQGFLFSFIYIHCIVFILILYTLFDITNFLFHIMVFLFLLYTNIPYYIYFYIIYYTL